MIELCQQPWLSQLLVPLVYQVEDIKGLRPLVCIVCLCLVCLCLILLSVLLLRVLSDLLLRNQF